MTKTLSPVRALAAKVESYEKVARTIKTSQGNVTVYALTPGAHNSRRYLICGTDGKARAIVRCISAGRYVIEGSAYSTAQNPYLAGLERLAVEVGLADDLL